MKRLDLGIQGFLILPAIAGLIGYAWGETGAIMITLYAQLFIGVYQLFSAAVRFVIRKNLNGQLQKWLKGYWISSLGLIAVMFAFAYLKIQDAQVLGVTLFFILPWFLALFYFRISWLDTFKREEKQSSFLPHINI